MPNAVSADSVPPRQIQHPSNVRSSDPAWSWPRFFRNAALIAIAGVVLTFFIRDGLIPNLIPKRFGVVEPGLLYRSGALTPAATRTVVERHGIRTIIDLGGFDRDPRADARAQATAESLGVDRHVLPLEGDARGDPNRYAEALRLIADRDRGPFLVHCAAGSERTGCTVALFRMIEQGWTLDRALDEAQRYDHDPRKNPHLRGMIERWRDDVEAAVASGASIPWPPVGDD